MDRPLSNSALRDLLVQRTGLFIAPERSEHLSSCLRAGSRDLGLADLDSYANLLQNSPLTHPAWQRLLHHLTIGETYFFRDIDILRDKILPRQIERRRADGSWSLRIWSAGCATGEEPYSIAMLLRELLHDFASWKITILGTDINLQALDFARRGLYGAWSLRGSLPAYIHHYLQPQGNRWQLTPSIRDMVEFRYLNLIESNAGLVNADLIICRNVLFYLERQQRTEVAMRFKTCLVEGGELLTTSEPLQDTIRRDPLAIAPASPQKPILVRPVQPTSPPDDAIWQAKQSADQGRWSDAHRWLDKAEVQDRLNLGVHYLRALVYVSEHRPDDAIRELRRCLYLDHNFALGYFTLGNLYAQRGERDQAFHQWINAVALLDDQPQNEVVFLADGMTAQDILTVIRAQLAESWT